MHTDHLDELGNEFTLDYATSSFLHTQLINRNFEIQKL